MTIPYKVLVCILLTLILVGGWVNINSGLVQFSSLLFKGEVNGSQQYRLAWLILTDIRLPRVLLGIAIGFVLGTSGAVMQGLLRNPLAGPDLLGVTSCAALGAVITFYFGFAGVSWYILPLGGMTGACLSILLIFLLAGKTQSVLNIILAGVAVNAFAASLISLALNFSGNPYAMSEITYWLLGSLNNRSMNDVYMAMPFMIFGAVLCLFSGRYLNALSLGEETARSLGFNPIAERVRLIIAVGLSVGAAVSVSGSIGFVGLVVPHIFRPMVGYQPSRLILVSGLGGAFLVLLADILVQVISLNQELKLGVVTALIGGPFFLYLIYHLRQEAV